MDNRTKILCISSHGGHLHELKETVKNVSGDMVWITHRTKHTEKLLGSKKHYFIIDPVTNKFKFIINALQSFFYLLLERPNVIISTGAGIAVPAMILGKKLFKAKLIYIESAAAVVEPTKTGMAIYKYADLFLIQWKALKKYYPDSQYVGIL